MSVGWKRHHRSLTHTINFTDVNRQFYIAVGFFEENFQGIFLGNDAVSTLGSLVFDMWHGVTPIVYSLYYGNLRQYFDLRTSGKNVQLYMKDCEKVRAAYTSSFA